MDLQKFSKEDNEHKKNDSVPLNDYAFAEFKINLGEYANSDKDLITSETKAPIISDLISSDDSDHDCPGTLQTVSSFIDAFNGVKIVRTFL